jgi:multidrug efflux pump subunit AcrA (membrane-fusion protein)
MNQRWIVPIFVIAGLLAACRTAPDVRARTRPTNSAPVMVVTVATATVGPMSSSLRALGITVANHHVTIRAPSSGRVVDMTLKNGDQVRKGQVIGYIVNREIEAAQAGLEVARKLDPQGAAALSDSVSRYSKGNGIPIVAPDSGVVSRPPVTSGQMVADLDPIAELIDPSSIYVQASVPVDEFHFVTPGMSATVTCGLRPGATFAAKVGAMIPSFDQNSATAPVRLDFSGPESISEIGAPVEARIVTKTVPDAISIPSAALFQDVGENRYHVFVVGADGLAHRVDVTIGIRDPRMTQVLGGIKAGDRVITSGGYALSDGLRVQVAGTPS